MKKNYAEKLACLFRILTIVAIVIGGYVFLGQAENVFGLAGTQWILIAILFAMLAVNAGLCTGGCYLFNRSNKCDENRD